MTAIPPVRVSYTVDGVERVVSANSRVQKSLSSLSLSLASLAKGYGLLEIGRFVADSVEAAAALSELSQRTGATVKTLSILEFAAKRAQVDVAPLAQGFRGLSLSLNLLRGGDRKAVDAFQGIGLAARDLKGLSVDQTFLKIVEAMSRLPDGFDKSAAASKIFGRAGSALIPLLDDLAHNGFEKVTAVAEKMGAVIDEKTAKAADKFHDRLTDLKGAAEGAARSILNPLLPSLTKLVMEFDELLTRKPGDTLKHDIEDIARLIDKLGGMPLLLPLVQGAGQAAATGPSANRDLGHRAAPFISPEAVKVVHQLTDAEKQHKKLLEEMATAAGALLKLEKEARDDAMAARDATHSQFVDALRQTGGVGSFEELIARQKAQTLAQGPGTTLTLTEQVARQHAEEQAASLAYVRQLQAEADATNIAFQNIGQSIRDGVASELDNMFQTGAVHAQNFLNILQRIVAQLLAAKITAAVFGLFSRGIPAAPTDVIAGGLSGNFTPSMGHAEGGYISGPGTGTSDSIPAYLSNGEFVVNAAATAQNIDLLSAINDMGRRVTPWSFNHRGYASGGLVASGSRHTVELMAPEGWSGRVSGDSDVLDIVVRNRRAIRQALG